MHPQVPRRNIVDAHDGKHMISHRPELVIGESVISDQANSDIVFVSTLDVSTLFIQPAANGITGVFNLTVWLANHMVADLFPTTLLSVPFINGRCRERLSILGSATVKCDQLWGHLLSHQELPLTCNEAI